MALVGVHDEEQQVRTLTHEVEATMASAMAPIHPTACRVRVHVGCSPNSIVCVLKILTVSIERRAAVCSALVATVHAPGENNIENRCALS